MKNELYLFLPLFQNTISIHFQMFFSISKLTCKKVNFESLTENSELFRTLYDHERWLHDGSKRKTFKVADCEFQLLYT